MTAPQEWLTPDELAARIQIPKTTLADWRVDGKGPRFRHMGRHVRYRMSDVLAWENAPYEGVAS
jgi:excisionase family DNA binding protein